MNLTRRDALRLVGLIAAAAALPSCGPLSTRRKIDPGPLGDWPLADGAEFRALNRLTFGPRLDERAQVASIGLQAWIEEQLAAERIDDRMVGRHLRWFDTLNLAANELADWEKEQVCREIRQATLLRQIYSRRQLYEVMVEFWADHFNISIEKGECWFLLPVHDREAIRPHALGHFHDLLSAIAHSPAMLVYLDNQANLAQAPNENYARELLELHTLGIDSGYTQADVMELARCLTGWTVKRHFWRGDFTFDAASHAAGPKVVLGRTIAPAGQREAEQVLEILAEHPSTARHIATKLARRFIADVPPPTLVERAAMTFLRTHGDLRALLRVILLDGLDPEKTYLRPKFKRPVNFITSALRMLNARTDGGDGLLTYLARMGQLPFAWPMPDGYPDTAPSWQGNLMPRWQFALALVRGEIPHTTIQLDEIAGGTDAQTPANLIDRLSLLLLGTPIAAAVRDSLVNELYAAGARDDELPALIVAGMIASPSFQWR